MGRSLPHGCASNSVEITPVMRGAFILANTTLKPVENVPEILLYQADDVYELWHKSEQLLQEKNIPLPFWAFAWAGGVGLARFILDNPHYVGGKTVCDFASGSGLVGLAAYKAGAAHVMSVDIDPFAFWAMQLNAKANSLPLSCQRKDIINTVPQADIILAGDVFYDCKFATALTPWFRELARKGKSVFIGDPGRAYVPDGLKMIARYEVNVSPMLEEGATKSVIIWQF